MAYKVLIVDDQQIARMLFESVLLQSGRYTVCACLSEATAAPALCAQLGVDVVLMDVVLGDRCEGLDATREIKAQCPHTKVVMVTSMPEVSFLRRAREAGADSFWYKEAQKQPLLSLLDRTMAGEQIYPDATPALAIGEAMSADFTERELVVLFPSL